jgi:uncharacterized protein YcfL
MNKTLILSLTLTAAVFLIGCRPAAQTASSATRTIVTGHEGGAYSPRNTTKYALENEAKFVTLDSRVQRSVTCSGLQERVLEDGRLEVGANIRNRLERRIQVQIQCVFKDAQGFGTGDETPWQDLILTETAQETVRFQSLNDKAKGYTIRVREAR